MFLFNIGKFMIIDFFKKILGLPTEEEKIAAKNAAQAPYKIEPPVINNKTGDLVEITKVRKPRKPKVVVEKKKAAEPKLVPAAKKTRKPRSTKS